MILAKVRSKLMAVWALGRWGTVEDISDSEIQDGGEITQADFNNYQRLFNHFDRDGSGALSFEEVYKLLRTLGVALERPKVREIFDKADFDSTGQIEFDEFIAMILHNKCIITAAKARSVAPAARNGFQLPVKALMPDAMWRKSWDALILAGISYYAMSTSLFIIYSVLDRDPHLPLWFYTLADFVLLPTFGLNIWIRSRTAYTDNRSILITDLSQIKAHYLRGVFAPDLIATLPISTFLFLTPLAQNKWAILPTQMLRLLYLPGVFVLFATSEQEHVIDPTYITFFYHRVPQIKLFFWTLLATHWIAVVAMALQIGVKLDPDTQEPLEEPGYINGMYWTLQTLSTCGFGDFILLQSNQRVYALVILGLSLLANATITARIEELFATKSISEEAQIVMRHTLVMLQNFTLPGALSNEILSFQHHVLKTHLGSNTAETIQDLPPILLNKMALHRRIALLTKVALFKNASLECRTAFAMCLKPQVVPPGEYITITGEGSHQMYMLTHGFAHAMNREGKHVAVFPPGSFFEESAILPGNEGTVIERSISALTYCNVFSLAREDVEITVARFPELAMRMQEAAGVGSFRGQSPSSVQRSKNYRKLWKKAMQHVKNNKFASIHSPESSLQPVRRIGKPSDTLYIKQFMSWKTFDTSFADSASTKDLWSRASSPKAAEAMKGRARANTAPPRAMLEGKRNPATSSAAPANKTAPKLLIGRRRADTQRPRGCPPKFQIDDAVDNRNHRTLLPPAVKLIQDQEKSDYSSVGPAGLEITSSSTCPSVLAQGARVLGEQGKQNSPLPKTLPFMQNIQAANLKARRLSNESMLSITSSRGSWQSRRIHSSVHATNALENDFTLYKLGSKGGKSMLTKADRQGSCDSTLSAIPVQPRVRSAVLRRGSCDSTLSIGSLTRPVQPRVRSAARSKRVLSAAGLPDKGMMNNYSFGGIHTISEAGSRSSIGQASNFDLGASIDFNNYSFGNETAASINTPEKLMQENEKKDDDVSGTRKSFQGALELQSNAPVSPKHLSPVPWATTARRSAVQKYQKPTTPGLNRARNLELQMFEMQHDIHSLSQATIRLTNLLNKALQGMFKRRRKGCDIGMDAVQREVETICKEINLFKHRTLSLGIYIQESIGKVENIARMISWEDNDKKDVIHKQLKILVDWSGGLIADVIAQLDQIHVNAKKVAPSRPKSFLKEKSEKPISILVVPLSVEHNGIIQEDAL